MTEIVRNEEDMPDGECVEFTVYESPNTKGTFFGYYSFNRQIAPDQVSFVQSDYGVDVTVAFEEAKQFAKNNGIPTILIIDPDNLFSE